MVYRGSTHPAANSGVVIVFHTSGTHEPTMIDTVRFREGRRHT